ncbi:Fanconi anemia group J protein [Eufriesea mexicana]|uniref:DNA 5'-3' helicase n=1 Tax=Eufriesea mexicana TaxID=516756 RepID=A0A310SLI7_9HYME|nr:Fanconi anemia group J protein [Eufriesea mexicana]
MEIDGATSLVFPFSVRAAEEILSAAKNFLNKHGPTTRTEESGDHPGCSGMKCADKLDDCSEYGKFEDKMEEKKSDKVKISKIYYGTRTHKQIEQVVRELQKTCYKNKKMTILSSREHTCIQDSNKNKTELCNELLDPTKVCFHSDSKANQFVIVRGIFLEASSNASSMKFVPRNFLIFLKVFANGCPYNNELNKRNSSFYFTVNKLGPVWDIEDLVAIGRENKWCPYFGARNLMEFADIIFCPYNYIIDPDIRACMQLDLKDQVIILDEAHNIEDICRDVASVSFREDHLSGAANECESITKQRLEDFATYSTLKSYIFKLVEFLKSIPLNKVDYNSDNLSSPYWTGVELLELFNMHELGESTYSTFLVACKAALADVEKEREDNRMLVQKNTKPIISAGTKIIIEHLMFAIRMITSKGHVNDYRACVTESTVKDFKMATDNTWLSAKKFEQRVRTLKLLCMNPGVIFSPLAQNARCIILASGTLTPTASFQSELGTSFVHVLNTGHVIPKEQVYATCVPKGPNGINLRANYQAVNSWTFQDELGQVLLDVCESVPHGILCFFSSYNVMHTQIGRWKNNSIWNKITNVKQVFTEPRYSNDLTAIMNEYREVIENTSDGPREGITGALFLAVFRGKVAEGIDFKDNEARCVVTVGIPYGVRKDPVIDMKIKYNDTNSTKGLLRGSGWYCIQAFRALNQALGRCLRHVHDWGAVLLVDERFLMQENKQYLPKWVKTMWVTENEYNLNENLQKFVARQKAREKKTLTLEMCST